MANGKQTDYSTAIGIVIALIMLLLAISIGKNSNPLSFVDWPSVFIVLGGTFFVTLASFTAGETFRTAGVVANTMFYHAPDASEEAVAILEMAEIARRDGFLKLQDFSDNIADKPFLQKGINMVIDGVEPQVTEKILYQDINSTAERHSKGVAILRKGAEIAPAMGLIGTLVGLVQMLGALENPATIGPAMATALLTTLYGAILAYVVLNPLATKLERNTQEETLLKRLYAQGVLAIAKQENPRRLEMLFNTILPPEKRIRYFEQ
jgi:chemotaxis protein MotA